MTRRVFSEFNGVPGDPNVDSAIPWNDAMANLAQGDQIYLDGGGDYYFQTPPAEVPVGVALEGGTRFDRLVRLYSDNNPFIRLAPGPHTRIAHLSILTHSGGNGGTALRALATASQQPQYNVIEDVTISALGTGYFHTGINFNGNAAGTFGCRKIDLINILIGNGVRDFGVVFNNTKGITCASLHTANDLTQSVDPQKAGLFITGLEGHLSDNVNITGNGVDLRFGYCAGAIATLGAAGNIVFEPGASNCHVTAGSILGIVWGAGVNNNRVQ